MDHLPGTQLGIIGLPHLAAELTAAGYAVVSGESERVAVAAIRRAFSSGERFPILSADLSMPGLTPWLTTAAAEVTVVQATAMRDASLSPSIVQVEMPASLGAIVSALNLSPLPGLDQAGSVDGTVAPTQPVIETVPVEPTVVAVAPPPPPPAVEALPEPEPQRKAWAANPWEDEEEESPVVVPAAPALNEGVPSLSDFASDTEPVMETAPIHHYEIQPDLDLPEFAPTAVEAEIPLPPIAVVAAQLDTMQDVPAAPAHPDRDFVSAHNEILENPVTIPDPMSPTDVQETHSQESRVKLATPTPAQMLSMEAPAVDVQSAINRGRAHRESSVSANKSNSVVLVVAVAGGVGTTTVALALADAAAAARRRAIVIDGAHGDVAACLGLNSPTPTIADFTGNPAQVVLSPAVIAGMRPGKQALKFGAVVSTGPATLNPQLVEAVSEMAELTIVDMATLRPGVTSADALVAAGATVLVVVDESATSQAKARRELNRLAALGNPAQFFTVTNRANSEVVLAARSIGVIGFDPQIVELTNNGLTAYDSPAVADVADRILSVVLEAAA